MRFVVLKRAQKKSWLIHYFQHTGKWEADVALQAQSRKNEKVFSDGMTKTKLKNIKNFWQFSENEWHLAFFDTNECLHI